MLLFFCLFFSKKCIYMFMRCKLFDCNMMKHIRDNAETSIRNAIYFKKIPLKIHTSGSYLRL